MHRQHPNREYYYVQHPTSLVFLFVVMAGLVMGYARADPPLTESELASTIVLSLVYLLTGTVVFMAVLTSASPGSKILYLAFQIVLGLSILHLERGNGWLVMLPLASHSVALFSPRIAILSCLLITLGISFVMAGILVVCGLVTLLLLLFTARQICKAEGCPDDWKHWPFWQSQVPFLGGGAGYHTIVTGIAILMLLAASSGCGAVKLAQAFTQTGNDFMTALKDANYEVGYGLCAAELQAEVGAATDLESMIEDNDARPEEWTFSSWNLSTDAK